jgi:hypothetical protein
MGALHAECVALYVEITASRKTKKQKLILCIASSSY